MLRQQLQPPMQRDDVRIQGLTVVVAEIQIELVSVVVLLLPLPPSVGLGPKPIRRSCWIPHDYTASHSTPRSRRSEVLGVSRERVRTPGGARSGERERGREMSKRAGPPKHQNTYAWKPNLGRKINETEPGGRFRPLSEITGVCQRCRDQIDWKRKYGKYKPIVEPAKCQKCSKRNVRQAYHNVCTGCSKELGICAKCCTSVKQLVGRDAEEANSERKELEEAIRYARERERRTLLRLMNKNKDEESGPSVPKIVDRDREGDLFPVASLDEYAEQAVQKDESDEEDARDFVKD